MAAHQICSATSDQTSSSQFQNFVLQTRNELVAIRYMSKQNYKKPTSTENNTGLIMA